MKLWINICQIIIENVIVCFKKSRILREAKMKNWSSNQLCHYRLYTDAIFWQSKNSHRFRGAAARMTFATNRPLLILYISFQFTIYDNLLWTVRYLTPLTFTFNHPMLIFSVSFQLQKRQVAGRGFEQILDFEPKWGIRATRIRTSMIIWNAPH